MSNLLQQKINQNMTLSNREGHIFLGTFGVFPADETKNYTCDQANRLTKVELPSGTEVEFTYDGMGRRLTKTVTETSGTDEVETTYKYHYLGGQITTIDIDQTATTTPFASHHFQSPLSSQQPPVIPSYDRESQPKSGAILSAEMPDRVGHDVVGVGHDVDETQQTQTTSSLFAFKHSQQHIIHP